AMFLEEVEKAKDDLQTVENIVVVGGEEDEIRKKGFIPFPDLMKNPDTCEVVPKDRMDVGLLLFTSGTT
ncbi:MAG: hypothetical protein GTO08_06655, partial [Deltaproteobacteria bacterium]|nr:hypothetical protein [Deltaproteobacteria bacterium]